MGQRVRNTCTNRVVYRDRDVKPKAACRRRCITEDHSSTRYTR